MSGQHDEPLEARLCAGSCARIAPAPQAGRGRDGGHPPPPAPIRTCRITAYGSCLRYVTHRSAPRDKGAYCGRSE